MAREDQEKIARSRKAMADTLKRSRTWTLHSVLYGLRLPSAQLPFSATGDIFGYIATYWRARRAAIAAKARSDAIDAQILHDIVECKRKCTILILGSPDAGKTTVLKQMKIRYQGGFTFAERVAYRNVIYRNLVECAQTFILRMRFLQKECRLPENRVHADRVLAFEMHPTSDIAMPQDIAQAIHSLWHDPITTTVMDNHAVDFCLMDSASYFLPESLRIGTPDYVPTEMDVLRARAPGAGIAELRINISACRLHLFDAGARRSKPHKWIHCFEHATLVIFVVALSEYDQYDHAAHDERNENRMLESLVLFESVVNSRWFLRTSVVLLLNKIDVFKRKLPRTPLENHFPEYTGGPDINKAAKYILWRFMQANRARLSIYSHLVEAVADPATSLIFAALKETILQNALKDSGIF